MLQAKIFKVSNVNSVHDTAVICVISMKRKRQDWSNCNILKQLYITKDQEKLVGNTVDLVFRSPLAGGSHEISHTCMCEISHTCMWLPPSCEKISTVLGRRLQDPQVIQGNQSSLLLPWIVPDCAPSQLGTQVGF